MSVFKFSNDGQSISTWRSMQMLLKNGMIKLAMIGILQILTFWTLINGLKKMNGLLSRKIILMMSYHLALIRQLNSLLSSIDLLRFTGKTNSLTAISLCMNEFEIQLIALMIRYLCLIGKSNSLKTLFQNKQTLGLFYLTLLEQEILWLQIQRKWQQKLKTLFQKSLDKELMKQRFGYKLKLEIFKNKLQMLKNLLHRTIICHTQERTSNK